MATIQHPVSTVTNSEREALRSHVPGLVNCERMCWTDWYFVEDCEGQAFWVKLNTGTLIPSERNRR